MQHPIKDLLGISPLDEVSTIKDLPRWKKILAGILTFLIVCISPVPLGIAIFCGTVLFVLIVVTIILHLTGRFYNVVGEWIR